MEVTTVSENVDAATTQSSESAAYGDLIRRGDSQQYEAVPHKSDPDRGVLPEVKLVWITPDPLGAMAFFQGVYSGRFYDSLSEVTDEERMQALIDVQKTHLQAPLEVVKVHLRFDGVDRAFTHQLVRQRTAVYAQESMRFSVLGDLIDATTLPPSLAGTKRMSKCEICYGSGYIQRHGWRCGCGPGIRHVADCGRPVPMEPCPGPAHVPANTKEQRQRELWDDTIHTVDAAYHRLVEDGMPAEEARGLLPHATATRINYVSDLRNMKDHAGNRLCTQAQFTWRSVFTGIVAAIRNYGNDDKNCVTMPDGSCVGKGLCMHSPDRWQYQAIADSTLFRPVCYQIGHCPFTASFDRACTIRDRVQGFAANGIPSGQWHKEWAGGVKPINPAEWLMNPGAARL